MKVAKFGGSSLANAAQIKKVCDIVLSDPERKLVVVSAPGKRFAEDVKVTDMLIELANTVIDQQPSEQALDAICERYQEIADGLEIPGQADFVRADLLHRMSTYEGDTMHFMDNMKASGEDNCARLVTKYLISIGKKARYINPRSAGLVLSEQYGNATVLPQSYDRLRELKKIDGIGIFPGFFGYSLRGDVVTFPRGGSDISGAILAAAVGAEVYENFTDVDYVYAVNPNIVENPRPIKNITYSEMRELSYAGFNVYQEEALLPVYKAGISVCIKNVNNPNCPGTLISATREQGELPVIGVASDDNFSSIYIGKYLMNRELGFGRRVLRIIENEGVSFEHIPSGIDNMSVVVRTAQLTPERRERIVKGIKEQLSADDVEIQDGMTIIMLVGEGMNHNVGVAARATAALSASQTNIEMISQGSSEVSLIFGVRNVDEHRAVEALYREFFE